MNSTEQTANNALTDITPLDNDIIATDKPDHSFAEVRFTVNSDILAYMMKKVAYQHSSEYFNTKEDTLVNAWYYERELEANSPCFLFSTLMAGMEELELGSVKIHVNKDELQEMKVHKNGKTAEVEHDIIIPKLVAEYLRNNQNLTPNDKNYEILKIVLISHLRLLPPIQTIESLFNLYKEYSGCPLFDDVLLKALDPAFYAYMAALPERTQIPFLAQFTEAMLDANLILEECPPLVELEIMAFTQVKTLASTQQGFDILKNKSKLKAVMNQAFTDHLNHAIPLSSIKTPKLRAEINQLHQHLSSIPLFGFSPYSMGDYDNVMMHQYANIMMTAGLAIRDSNSQTAEMNAKITRIKEEIKANIDKDLFKSALDAIDTVRSLQQKSDNELIDEIAHINDRIRTLSKLDHDHPSSLLENNHLHTHDDKHCDTNELVELLEDEVKALNEQQDKDKKEINKLKTINDSLQQTSKPTQSLDPAIRQALFGTPSLQDVKAITEAMHPHCVFSDNIDNQIAACNYNNPNKLLRTLDLICHDYFNAIMSGDSDSKAKDLLLDGYAAQESKSVRNNERLYKKRIFSINGTPIQFSQHITIGTQRNPQQTCQVYFMIKEGKVFIGYIGEHLPLPN